MPNIIKILIVRIYVFKISVNISEFPTKISTFLIKIAKFPWSSTTFLEVKDPLALCVCLYDVAPSVYEGL